MTVTLTPDQQDVVTELMNLGVGRAADAFSRLVGDEVLLSVPEVQFCSQDQAQTHLQATDSGQMAGVMQTFSGFASGTAALIFPGPRSMELVRLVVGDDLPAEDISELEQETLAELGNIILNHCLATIGNTLQAEVRASLPETYRGLWPEMFEAFHRITPAPQVPAVDEATLVMLVQIDFTLRSRNLRGYLAFLIDMNAAQVFLSLIDRYLDSLSG
ncbi:chemotaxis protein CheC [Novispirillum itersonii]|uniref:Chemotaxis protein CheC n=1 Tax=Novispirillum itersonii TaxID=189 RepID=A0A7X0DM25_NOVIT|nr:chemotaxis protein CheC [Novispirillum itersonii]MBB6209854.1 chemotaxis protein CheC [Novispirillum itersonii]